MRLDLPTLRLCQEYFLDLIKQIVQIIIIPSTLSSLHRKLLLLLLLLRQLRQDVLQLLLRDFLPQLTRPRQHDESILDIFSPRCLDQTYPAQSIRG